MLSPPAAIVRSGKIDVYHMIAGDLLGSLHLSIEETIPAQSPFSAFGTRPLLDIQNLHRAFTLAHTLQITAPPLRKNSAAGLLSSTPAKPTTSEADLTLKVTKIGLLSRKGAHTVVGRS